MATFQQWVMSACDGKPSIALAKIEATGIAVTRSTIYYAMRHPVPFRPKLARAIITASEGACTLVELVDADVIRSAFDYADPDIKRAALRLAIARAEAMLVRVQRHYNQAHAAVTRAQAELDGLRAELATAATAPRRRAARRKTTGAAA